MTKGRTLQALEHKVQNAQILPNFMFTIDDWLKNKKNIKQKICKLLGPSPWIVRSSFSGEDKLDTSNAGAFASVLNVESELLEKAIDTVKESYTNNNLNEEILVQPMLKNVEASGVAFSHDPSTGSPDRIISWSEGPDTQLITSGKSGNIWQIAAGYEKKTNQELLAPVGKLIEELLVIFNGTPIDCEFAISSLRKKRTLWLLQVRPLVLAKLPRPTTKHIDHLRVIKEKIEIGMLSKPFIVGARNVYGIMPDWNPAEIIGRRPKPLAISLYQELITDSIWAYQRHNYGYRNLRSYPLMLNLSGCPYIDVRISLNSFIPSSLDDNIAGRLVDYYLEKLVSKPMLHDKIEFEIVFSCYTFDIRKNLSNLSNYGFSKNDQDCIAKSLLDLTNQIIHPQYGLWRKDADKLRILNEKYQTVITSNLTPIEKIYWLLEDCKRYGTLPFAGLARAAFIGVQMLKSLVNLNFLSEDNYKEFLESISTVNSQMLFDQKTMSKTKFLKKYGHLRPGTYDILSPRYDAKPDEYFSWNKTTRGTKPRPSSKKAFFLTDCQKKLINEMLVSNEIQTDANSLMDFIRNTIELREQAKFDFTRNLSEVMSLIEKVGAEKGMTVEDISYSNIAVFRDLYISTAGSKKVLEQSISKGKAEYQDTLSISLPPLITDPNDIFSFPWPNADPNYITQKKVTASVTTSIKKDVISSNIICIPNADPGYDWIFSYPIAGFITAWGGANSHMAIRAVERQVPAVIGAGEILFQQWSSSKRLMIDCAEQRVEIIQ